MWSTIESVGIGFTQHQVLSRASYLVNGFNFQQDFAVISQDARTLNLNLSFVLEETEAHTKIKGISASFSGLKIG